MTIYDVWDARNAPQAEPSQSAETRTDRDSAGKRLRPGDDYNQRASWDDVLVPHGWVRVGKGSRGETLWRRPGKTEGHSATTNATGNDTLIVHSTSTNFDISPASYTKFAAFALLNHDGDHSTAARDLRSRGYGDDTTDERLGFDDLYLTHDQLTDTAQLDRSQRAANALEVIETKTTFLDSSNIATLNREPYDDARGCPVCGLPVFYVPRADRFFHRDGVDNQACWRALLRGEAEGHNDYEYADEYVTRSQLRDVPTVESLIDGVLDRHTTFIVSGRKDTYKSFLVLDWLLSLATGQQWHGRAVERAKVLYVVGEGQYGLSKRVDAWEKAHGVDVDDDYFHVRKVPANLFKRDHRLRDLAARVARGGYDVVVFDTLHKNSRGAEENSAKDAGEIMASLDEIRRLTRDGAGSVGIVTHTGKGDVDTRGSSAFEDDADCVWRVRASDEDDDSSTTIKIELVRRKDGPEGLTMKLTPRPVDGTDSLVLATPGAFMVPMLDRVPEHAYPIMKLLARESVPADGLSASRILDEIGRRGKASVHRPLSWLMSKGYVQKCGRDGRPTYKITVTGASHLNEIDGTTH